MTTPSVALSDFAKGKVRRCAVCSLPTEIRDQVDATLRDGGVGGTIISRWLRDECRIELSDSIIQHHKSNAHHVHSAEVLEGS